MQHPLSDQIEDYLLNQLSEQQRSSFEQSLQADASLRQQTSAQQEIIEAIKSQRRLALKQNLSAIEVGMNYGSARLAGLWAAGIAACVGVAGLLWWQTQMPANEPVASANTVVVADARLAAASGFVAKSIDAKPKPNTDFSPKPDMSAQQPATSTAANRKTVEQPAKSSKSQSSTNSIGSFDKPEMGFSDEQNLIIGNSQDPSAGLSVSDKKTSSKKPEVILFKQQNQEYEYYEGKLNLYGDFEQNLYELIELNELDQHHLYLYLQKNYYQLSPTRQKQPLQKITDALLVNKLDILRKQKVY